MSIYSFIEYRINGKDEERKQNQRDPLSNNPGFTRSKAGCSYPIPQHKSTETKNIRLDSGIHTKQEELAANPANAVALQNEITALEGELDQLKLSEAARLVERYPNDLMYRFDLGVLYMKMGNVEGAVEQLQKSRGQPQRRVASLNYLGQCYQQMGLHDMAIETFKEAIADLPTMDGLKKDLLYNLGCAYELMGDQEQAVAAFKEIAKVDFSYRDVREKIMRKGPSKASRRLSLNHAASSLVQRSRKSRSPVVSPPPRSRRIAVIPTASAPLTSWS
jgi:tetratricopeptide (TPR) repeat protein